MSEKRPSKAQLRAFNYIKDAIDENPITPTLREIAKGLGYASVSTVANHVDALVEMGMLKKQENAARSLEIISPREIAGSQESSHIAWLRQEVAKREASPELTKEAQILKAALTLLDQTEEK